VKKDIEEAIKVLSVGGTILYPTDTIWGIGCDATNEKAVQSIYSIKGRAEKEGMLVLLDSPERLSQYVDIPEIAWEIINNVKSPLTIIYPGARNLAGNILSKDNSVGVRIVNDNFCINLIQKFRKPIVSTSANISGDSNPAIFNGINKKIIDSVDYVVKWRQDDMTRRKPSGIIKLGLNGEVKVIRE
jgi:L-threonylcarbamoyladenylate synthase